MMKKLPSRFYIKDGEKIMRVEPKYDIKRAGKIKSVRFGWCCMGKERRKGYSKGRAKMRRKFNIMMRKNKSENTVVKRLKMVDNII